MIKQQWYGDVYLLHFSEPYHHARHYIGFTSAMNSENRLDQHLGGFGSPLVRAVHTHGILVVMARVWRNRTRGLERRLKKSKNSRRFCPLCHFATVVSQPMFSIAPAPTASQ